MVNKQSRSPGELRRFEATGRVSTDVPSFAADTGAAFRTLEAVGAQLSGQLFKLAGEAAQRAGETAGLQSQQSGVAYLQARAAEAKGASIATSGSRAYTQSSGEVRKLISEAAQRHGIDPSTMLKIAELESSFNPGAKNPSSSAGGLFQFIDSTAQQYGLSDRYDPAQAADAGARLAKDNAAHLRRVLGREPSAGELYLAHQQGAGGAAKLLSNPQAPAASLVGSQAVKLNGGREGMTAAEFAGLWIRKAGGGVPDVAAGAGGANPSQMSIPTQPLALRRDGTIYGEAYDRAAMSAYTWRLDQGLSNDLSAAHEQFRDDPSGFQQELGRIRETYMADESFADPRIREVFEKSFTTRAEAYTRDVASRHGQRLDAEEKASAAEALDARLSGIEKDAYLMGANPEGDRIVGEQVERTMRSIDAAVAGGSLTPAQAAQWRGRVRKGAMQSRLHGVFDALETVDQKREFALGLMTDEKLLSDFGFADVRAISDLLFNRALSEGGRKTGAEKVESSRIEALLEDDIASISTSGEGLDPAESGLSADLVEGKLGPEKLAAWQEARRQATHAYQATAGMEGDNEAEILTRLDTLKPEPGKAGFADQQAIYSHAAKRAREIIEERVKDPLGQAMRAGAVDIQPLDFSDGGTLVSSIAGRRTAARGVADLYGTPRRFLMPGEQEKLAAELEANPLLMQSVAGAAVSALGSDAPAFLAEISQSSPVLAHAAGVAAITGDTSLASDIALTLAARRDKIYTAKMPPAGQMRTAAEPYLGTALAMLPATQSAMLETATLLFEQAANREGFDSKEIAERGSPANKAWLRALDRAAGRRTLGGVEYGGFAELNGQQIMVPPDMPATEPARLWDAINQDMLERLPPVDSANGVPLTARQIRRGRLVNAGDGVYRVALGDPQGENPKWLATPDGRHWQVDIRELARIEAGL